MKRATLTLVLITLLCALPSHADDKLHHRPQYTILPGDVLDLHYRYTPSFDQTVTVQPDGYVNLNVVGNIRVADLTVDAARETILKIATQQLNEPELTISLKEFHHPYVVVAGEVAKPGKIDLQEGATALQAILLAGGFGENAKSGQVIVYRKVNTTIAEVHLLKLSSLTRTADLEHDLLLQPGDMIMVPRDKVSRISRFIKLTNLGIFLNPLDNIP